MNKEDIDKLIIAINNEDYEIILKYAGIEINEDPEDIIEREEKEIIKRLINNIEQGDYNYFISREYNDEEKEIFIELLIHSKNKENIKEILEKRKQLNLNAGYIKELLTATTDPEYIKNFIENNKEELYLEDGSAIKIVELIKEINDPEYTKSIIDDFKGIEKYRFYIEEVEKLIKSTKDSDYIKHCVEYIIENKILYFDNSVIVELIALTKDVEYIKSFIEDDEKLEKCDFDNYNIKNLIKATKEEKYIKNILEDTEKIQKYRFYNFQVQELIEETEDVEYIKNILEDDEKIKNYNFRNYEIRNLIKATKDNNYIKSILEDKERIKKYSLEAEDLRNIIKIITDFEYIKSIIENEKRLKELEINDYKKFSLILITEDIEYIERKLKELELKKDKSTPNKKVNLPKDMTIGVEIETEGELSNEILKISNIIYKGWKCKRDGSLNSGLEVISPILKGDEPFTTESIKSVCARLSGLEQSVSSRCGGHVHIGADYLKSDKALTNLTDIWTNFEEMLYLISNDRGSIPRCGTLKYAKPISKKFENFINKGFLNLDTKEDLEKFLKEFQKDSRYYGINFNNLGKKYKNTIEFRLSNGTIDTDTWIENINLFGYIVKASQEIAEIQIKKEQLEKLSEEELNKFKLLEKIRNEKLNNEEKLQILMELVIPESERLIYTERYRVNSFFINDRPDLKEKIEENITKNPIKLDKKKLKLLVFGDKEFISLEDLDQISFDIMKERERQRSEAILD